MCNMSGFVTKVFLLRYAVLDNFTKLPLMAVNTKCSIDFLDEYDFSNCNFIKIFCISIITLTLNGRIPSAIEATDDIINSINHLALMGHNVAYAAVEQYKMKIASKILTNCDSWIGLTNLPTNR